MILFDWLENLKEFIEKDQEKLTEQVSFKLNEIVQFVDQYSILEKEIIPFIDKETAHANDKKRQLLKLFQPLPITSDAGESEEEYKTPNDSFGDGEQGTQSPMVSPKAGQQLKQKLVLLFDGMSVQFKDFEILESIGEGSFGRVFKARKRDNG